METIQWKESFNVGNQLIDSQHKGLVGMINTMIERGENSDNSEMISEMLSKIIEYAGLHFKSEESYMESISYPFLKTHKKEHRQFKLKACRLCLKEMGHDTLALEEILTFLSQWLVGHILSSDNKYKIFHETRAGVEMEVGQSGVDGKIGSGV